MSEKASSEAEGIILRELQRAVERRARELGLRSCGAGGGSRGSMIAFGLDGRQLVVWFKAEERPQFVVLGQETTP